MRSLRKGREGMGGKEAATAITPLPTRAPLLVFATEQSHKGNKGGTRAPTCVRDASRPAAQRGQYVGLRMKLLHIARDDRGHPSKRGEEGHRMDHLEAWPFLKRRRSRSRTVCSPSCPSRVFRWWRKRLTRNRAQQAVTLTCAAGGSMRFIQRIKPGGYGERSIDPEVHKMLVLSAYDQ